jgi:hypothetical protein
MRVNRVKAAPDSPQTVMYRLADDPRRGSASSMTQQSMLGATTVFDEVGQLGRSTKNPPPLMLPVRRRHQRPLAAGHSANIAARSHGLAADLHRLLDHTTGTAGRIPVK